MTVRCHQQRKLGEGSTGLYELFCNFLCFKIISFKLKYLKSVRVQFSQILQKTKKTQIVWIQGLREKETSREVVKNAVVICICSQLLCFLQMTHIHKQSLHESCTCGKTESKLKLCFNLGGNDSISGLCIDLWENTSGSVVCPPCACLKHNKGRQSCRVQLRAPGGPR